MSDFHGLPRGRFLQAAGLGLAGAIVASSSGEAALAAGAGPPPAADSPAKALALLKEGNARFVAGTPQCGPLTARRLQLEEGQAPFAVILGCSDSRVPLDTVFDTSPGNLFGVRVAGNFVNTDGLASIEYGVAVLKAPLILVLGHSSCGAVDATLKFLKGGGVAPGHIQDLIVAIEPAAKAAKGEAGDWLANATAANVKANAKAIAAQSSIVADAVKGGSVQVVGGVYQLHTGKVVYL